MIEIWDENGMVAYVDESERGSAVFGVPDKGPRECAGKKIPMVKHGKFHCKPLPKNKPRGKKKKCVFKCDPGFRVQWTKSKLKSCIDAIIDSSDIYNFFRG